MRKRDKDRWVKALRSGKYKQGRGTLHRPRIWHRPPGEEEFCCLGVLCAITRDKHYEYVTVREKGLNEDQVELLINMNDQKIRSFNYIADYIEREL